MKRWLAPLWLVLGCAAPAANGPHPLELSYTRARAGEGCARKDEAACCDELSHRMHQARARHDDRSADETAELIALTCPARAEALLQSGRGGPVYRTGPRGTRSFVVLDYRLNLPPEDRVVWAGAYVDGARLGTSLARGEHALHFEVHVVSGLGPTTGQVFRLEQTGAVPANAVLPFMVRVQVKVERTAGAEPFRLQVVLPEFVIDDGVEGGVEGGVAGGVLGTMRRPPEAQSELGPFVPPQELALAGAPPLWLDVCPGGGGKVELSSLSGMKGPPHAHPRQFGALLDWARRLTFGPVKGQRCAHYFVDFSGPQTPIQTPSTRFGVSSFSAPPR
jgi:hypothetical protein